MADPIPAPIPDPIPPTKTFRTNVALQALDESLSTPYQYNALGHVICGHNHYVFHEPPALVTLPAAEADRILSQFGGEEVNPETGAVIRTVPRPLWHNGRAAE